MTRDAAAAGVVIAVIILAVGFVAFAIAAESATFFAIDAIVPGVSVAAISAVGPVFIVGIGLPRSRGTPDDRLRPCNAGAAIGGVLADRYDFNALNWMGAAAAALSAVVLVIGLLPAARSERARDSGTASDITHTATKVE